MTKKEWEKVCISTMTDPLFTSEDVKRLYQLKKSIIPSALYKYHSISSKEDKEKLLSNIVNERIWLSNPNQFNDPYDSAVSIKFDELYPSDYSNNQDLNFLSNDERTLLSKSSNQYKDLVRIVAAKSNSKNDEDKNKLIETLLWVKEKSMKDLSRDFQKGIKNQLRISCFSECSESIIMWSHYANHHRGICIEYSFQELDLFDPRFIFLNPVIYSEELQDWTNLFTDKNKTHFFSFILASMYKSAAWSYENEWRIIVPLHTVDYYFLKPKRIILGSRFEDEDLKKNLIEIALNKNIPIDQISREYNSFKLSKTPLKITTPS